MLCYSPVGASMMMDVRRGISSQFSPAFFAPIQRERVRGLTSKAFSSSCVVTAFLLIFGLQPASLR